MTGVQTCALPILLLPTGRGAVGSFAAQAGSVGGAAGGGTAGARGKVGVEKLEGKDSQSLPKEAVEAVPRPGKRVPPPPPRGQVGLAWPGLTAAQPPRPQ